jgi:diacylglycerol kinase (ATP)
MQKSGLSDLPLVILNPAANRGHITPYRNAVKRYISKHQAEYIETRQAGDATTLAYDAAKQHRSIVVVGGDGTLNEAASGILNSGIQVPLGIVPAGSGNDFASSALGLSNDPDTAIHVALTGVCRKVDAASIDGHYFINAFSVGLDGNITATAASLRRYPFMGGKVLYYTATLRHLIFGYGGCPWMRITIDGTTLDGPEMQRYVLVAVTNGPTYGAGFRINPKADPEDGQFAICVARFTPWLRALSLLPKVQKGLHEGEHEIRMLHGTHIVIETSAITNGQIDGEVIRLARYEIQILPAALTVRNTHS